MVRAALAVLVAAFVLAGCDMVDPVAAVVSPTAAPTVEPVTALRAAIEQSLGPGNRPAPRVLIVEHADRRVHVRWSINGNTTVDYTQLGAQLDTLLIVQAVARSGLDYEYLDMDGLFRLVQSGAESEQVVVQVRYSRTMIGRTDWQRIAPGAVYAAADAATIHPSFQRK